MKLSILISAFLFCFTLTSISQVVPDTIPPREVELIMNDGSRLTGTVVREDEKSITLLTDSIGEITVQKEYLKLTKELNPRTASEKEEVEIMPTWPENPNSTRNLISPTGFGLKKGEGYYQNVMVFFNSVSFGITGNFTIGAGLEAITTLIGDPLVYITPKFSFDINESWHAGAGLLYMNVPEFDEQRASLGMGYGVVTFGGKEHNATLGLGYGFYNEELAELPIVTLSGMTRIARKWSLVTENWLIPTSDTEMMSIHSFGARLIGNRVTVDFALVTFAELIENDGPVAIPFVDLVIPFGRK